MSLLVKNETLSFSKKTMILNNLAVMAEARVISNNQVQDIDLLDLVNDLVQLDSDGGREGELLLPLHEDGHCVGGWRVVRWRWACALFKL